MNGGKNKRHDSLIRGAGTPAQAEESLVSGMYLLATDKERVDNDNQGLHVYAPPLYTLNTKDISTKKHSMRGRASQVVPIG
jgi:hypothetical protein